MNKNQTKYIIFAALLLFAVILKLIPHMAGVKTFSPYFPWNFSPFWAIFLLMGATLQNKTTSKLFTFGIPLVVLLISDACMSLLYKDISYGFYGIKQIAVYGCFAATVLMGLYLIKNRSPFAIAGMGFGAALLFYVVTNFAVWYFGNGAIYPHTLSGLITCYTAALLHFKYSLVAQLIYLPLLFNPLVLNLIEEEPEPATLTQSATA